MMSTKRQRKKMAVWAVNAWKGKPGPGSGPTYTADVTAWITEAKRIYGALSGPDKTTMTNRITAGVECGFSCPLYNSGVIRTYAPSNWAALVTAVTT